jgi:hypothetical protein
MIAALEHPARAGKAVGVVHPLIGMNTARLNR